MKYDIDYRMFEEQFQQFVLSILISIHHSAERFKEPF